MKVIGISEALTESKTKITFVIDEELTQDIISKIAYGTLKFSGGGRFLTVQLPEDPYQPFTSESVDTLNEKLNAIETQIEREKVKRKQMLAVLAGNTVLPLM